MKRNLLERIQIIMKKDGKSETSFSKKIGVSQTTLNRKLKSAEDKQLMDLVGWILLAYPDISRTWLLTGKGEMVDVFEETAKQMQPSTEESVKTLLVTLTNTNATLADTNAKLLTKIEFLEKAGKVQSTDAMNVFGDGSAAHTLQRKTE